MTQSKPPIADILLERFVLNEVSDAERTQIKIQLKIDQRLQQRLQAIHARNQQVFRDYPIKVISQQIRHRLDEKKPVAAQNPKLSPLWPIGFAVCFTGFIVLGIIMSPIDNPSDVDGVRLKGLDPYLKVFRQSANATPEPLKPNTLAHENDVIQLSYNAVNQAYGVIFSIDGHQTVTLHYPSHENAIDRLNRNGDTLLPKSYELDDAPNYETFYFVTADEPFKPATILNAVRKQLHTTDFKKTDELALSTTFKQWSIRLNK